MILTWVSALMCKYGTIAIAISVSYLQVNVAIFSDHEFGHHAAMSLLRGRQESRESSPPRNHVEVDAGHGKDLFDTGLGSDLGGADQRRGPVFGHGVDQFGMGLEKATEDFGVAGLQENSI